MTQETETLMAKIERLAVQAQLETAQDGNNRLRAQRDQLLAALSGLLDQLEGIGIPDWHGAEGLSLEAAQSAIADAT